MSAAVEYPGALTGIRVVEVAEGIAGPLTGMHLADMGAGVVRVERPGGDPWRGWERIAGHPGRGRQHLQLNRGKRIAGIDLTRPEGRALAHELVRRADVLVTNLRPGVPARLGIDAATCTALNERLVHCSISGFGARGPLGRRGGYALAAEALAGLMTPAGPGEDDPPVAAAAPVTDTTAPLVAVNGILAALLARERSGRGQVVETSLLAAAVALNAHALVRADDAPPSVPTLTPALAAAYRTADGWLAVAAYSERLARRLAAAVGLPRLLDAPGRLDPADRRGESDAIAAELAAALRGRTTADWMQALAEAGVPASPVRARDALLDDGHARAEGLVMELSDAELGRVTMAGPPARLSATPSRPGVPGRGVGADTAAVLRELGLADAEVAALAGRGVVELAPARAAPA